MNDEIVLHTRRLTAAEALRRIRVSTSGLESWIGPDMTLVDLAVLTTNDLEFWTSRSAVRELGRILQLAFGVRIADWDAEWVPPARRTVGQLCDRLAMTAEVVVPHAVTICGSPCLSAGTFLAIRTLLARGGADVSDLAPSSNLAPYVSRWPDAFLGQIAGMAGGRVWVSVTGKARRRDGVLLLLAAIATIGGFVLLAATVALSTSAELNDFSLRTKLAEYLAAFGCVGCAAVVGYCFASSERLMRQLELHGLHDFRDLVNTILCRPLRCRFVPNPGTAP